MIRRPVVDSKMRQARASLRARSAWSPFWALLSREFSRAWRGGGGSAASAAFFISAAALTAFALGPDRDTLSEASPGALILALAIAAIVGLEHMFQEDLETGATDQLVMGPAPLEFVTLTKIGARAIAGLGVCILLAPIASAMFAAPIGVMAWSIPVVLLAAPGLVGAGATPAALTAGTARGGLLIAVLTPPLMAPTVIFAALTLQAASFNDPIGGLLALLAASSIISVIVGAVGAAAAIRLHVEH